MRSIIIRTEVLNEGSFVIPRLHEGCLRIIYILIIQRTLIKFICNLPFTQFLRHAGNAIIIVSVFQGFRKWTSFPNYKNVYNSQTTFMQPRNNKGSFIENFSPDDYTPHICESNGWQYFWSVQQDVDGLISLVGGKERFAADILYSYMYPATVRTFCG